MAISEENMTAWRVDCLKERHKVLTGKFSHWCHDWDGLTVDETTEEWQGCTCFPREETQHQGLASRVADILRDTIRLRSIGGEPCGQCGETIDYSFKVSDGCIEACAERISELVFDAMAKGDISVKITPHRNPLLASGTWTPTPDGAA